MENKYGYLDYIIVLLYPVFKVDLFLSLLTFTIQQKQIDAKRISIMSKVQCTCNL